ncbi:MAG: hypothetical protein R2851_18695 [Caldilineaceae bacterium]
MSVGVNMAKTGSLLIHEPLLATLDRPTRPLMRELPPWEQVRFLRFPGFYVDEGRPDEVIPQFYTLHPLWIGVAYSLGGLRAALLMTPLWGCWACGRSTWSGAAAGRGRRMAALLVLLTPLQLYFARYPTAGPIAQYFAWLGIWAFIGFANQDAPRRLFGLLAGLALGSLFLAHRHDLRAAAARGVGVLPAAGRRRLPGEWWFWLPFVLTASYAALHGLLFSAPYTLSTYGVVFAFLRTQIWLLAGVGGVGLALLLFLSATQQRRLTRWAAAVAQAAWPRYALAGLIVVAAVYGYVVRLRLGETIFAAYWYAGTDIPLTDHLNLVRLGWYLGPLGLLLAVAGGVLAALYALAHHLAGLAGGWRVHVVLCLQRAQQSLSHLRLPPLRAGGRAVSATGSGLRVTWLWRRGGTGMRRRQWRTVAALLGIALVVTLLYNSRLIGRHVDDAGGVAHWTNWRRSSMRTRCCSSLTRRRWAWARSSARRSSTSTASLPSTCRRRPSTRTGWLRRPQRGKLQGRPVYVVVRDDSATPLDLPMDGRAPREGTFAWHTARLEQSYDHMRPRSSRSTMP